MNSKSATLFYWSLLITLILMQSGCTWRQIKAKEELASTRNDVENLTSTTKSPQEAYPKQWIRDRLAHGISRTDVGNILVSNLFNTKPEVEQLGIAKADLIQAGRFKNPKIATDYEFKCNEQVATCAEFIFSISDLWQRPQRKRVAEDTFEIERLELIITMTNKIIAAETAYNDCLLAQKKVDLAQHSLRRITQNTTSQSRSYADFAIETATGNWKLHNLERQQELRTTFIALRDKLSISPPTSESVILTDELEYNVQPLADLNLLRKTTLETSTDIKRAEKKVDQAKSKLKLTQSKFIDSLVAGFSVERGHDGKKQGGTSFDMSLPIFDNNNAQVAKARFTIKKTEKELSSKKRKTLAHLGELYVHLQTIHETIDLHKKIIVANEKPLRIFKGHGAVPQDQVINFLLINDNLVQTELALAQAYHAAHTIASQLAVTAGRSPFVQEQDNKILMQARYAKTLPTLNKLKLTQI